MRLDLRLTALLLCLPIAGCITADPPKFDSKAPIERHAAAEALRGRPVESVMLLAEQTVSDLPLTTGLFRKVARESRAAVLSLYIRGSQPYRARLIPVIGPGISFDVPGEALGSAFFVHPDGYLISNDHVVRGSDQIVGRTSDGLDYQIEIVAVDPVIDLALLKVVDVDQTFAALPMGDSDQIEPGELVLAIGNPLGLGHSVTHGIVSQTERSLSNEELADGGRQPAYLQTDAAINPGSSGGPLITLNGNWIGIATSGVLNAQGLGFAVASRQVKEFVAAVLSGEGQGSAR